MKLGGFRIEPGEIEAASGLPVLTTASGGPEAFVDADIGVIVAADDVSSLAKAIKGLPDFIRGFEPADCARSNARSISGLEVFLRTFAAIDEDIAMVSKRAASARA